MNKALSREELLRREDVILMLAGMQNAGFLKFSVKFTALSTEELRSIAREVTEKGVVERYLNAVSPEAGHDTGETNVGEVPAFSELWDNI